MRRLSWSAQSVRDLSEIKRYIALDNPLAAHAHDVSLRIMGDADRLSRMPFIGRVGRQDGTREWVVRRTPYLIIYGVTPNLVRIITIRHGARDWPPKA